MSLCHQQSNNNNNSSSSKGSDPTSNTKGQTSQTCSSSHTPTQSHHYLPQQQQQKPVVTQGKNNNTKSSKTRSSSSQSTSVTNVNLAQTSSLTSNVLPTATLDLRYFKQRLNTRTFFSTGSQRSFVNPEIARRINLPVLEKVPIQLATFSNDSTL